MFAQPLHKEAVRGCLFLDIIAKKSGIMSEAVLVDVNILFFVEHDTMMLFTTLEHDTPRLLYPRRWRLTY